jgi:heme-degrading monooxygenase HmoA
MGSMEDVETDEEKPADEYADCVKGELESDMATSLPLAGPGVKPDTGELSPGTYVVATTYLALQPGKLDTAIELAGPVVENAFTLPGFVAVTLAGSGGCNSLRTITVWDSEEAMFAFVASPAHTRAMAQTSAISRGTSNTITWDGSDSTVTWEEAARQLGLEEGGDI